MKILKLVFGLGAATFVHVYGVRLWPEALQVVDPFLILVLLSSLGRSPGWGTICGSVVGLAHDALSGGLYGLYGASDTLVGYAVARLQQRLVIQRPLQVVILFAVAAALQEALLALLQFSMLTGTDLPRPWSVVAIMATTSFVGTALFLATRRLQLWETRWRSERQRRLKLELR